MSSRKHRQQALTSDLLAYVQYLKELKVEHARDKLLENQTLKIIERKNMPTTITQASLFNSATAESLEEIHAEIGDCHRCPLYQQRTQVVHSTGNDQARLFFIGEAPGADEDAQGVPFVGRAGQLLTKIIESIGLKREDVFIGNVNRCRPPGNRPPTTQEAETCRPFLMREIDVLNPEVIVVLGNTALKNLLNNKEGITKLRGKFLDYHGVKVMPTFHPAYLLRDPSKKKEVWEDMKRVRDLLNLTKAGAPAQKK